MKTNTKEYQHYVESIACLYTIDKGCIKVLLLKHEEEPYKGYWILPSTFVSIHETCLDAITKELEEKFHFMNLDLEEISSCSTPDRMIDMPVIAIHYLGFISDLESSQHDDFPFEAQWFDIHELPKIGYDHQLILDHTMTCLREKLLSSEILKKIFPSDFTLPEIQKAYESILGKKFDRRNFRKKFISLGLIEDTNDYDTSGTGRPAKLYRFKENVSVKKLF